MKLAIMQPYFLPYIGYFQLIRSVDKFVLYDDVDYIKGGWINRNHILVNGRKHLFTVPLMNGRQGVSISDVVIGGNYEQWKRKFMATVRENYSKSRNFEEIYRMLEVWLGSQSISIAEINYQSLNDIANWLGLPSQIVETSRCYGNRDLGRAERLVDICKKEGAENYINSAGGRELYDPCWFAANGVNLSILDPDLLVYPQKGRGFIPSLSILDFMMHVPQSQALEYLGEGRLN